MDKTLSRSCDHFSYHDNHCWICGASDDLTREHKIKRSDIKRVYGPSQLYIGHSEKRMKLAQSPNSHAFKFISNICNECNSSTTQPADFAYSQFIEALEARGSTLEAFNLVLEEGELAQGSSNYVSLARYFAKLLGNHMADCNYPIPNKLRSFVLGKTLDCNIQYFGNPRSFGAQIDDDKAMPLLAHGGLIVVADPSETTPRRIHSCLNILNFQISFEYEFCVEERQALFERHRDFCSATSAAVGRGVDPTITTEQWCELGIRFD